MDASEELAAKLKARENMRTSEWWGVYEDGQYDGLLAGRNPVSADIETFLSTLAHKAIAAKDCEGGPGETLLHNAIAAYVIEFMNKTVLPYAVKEQADLIMAGDSLEEV